MKSLLLLGSFAAVAIASVAGAAPFARTFDLREISPETVYSDELGYGYEPLENDETAARLFSVKVPEGNYRVTLALAPSTTVKAESRRLMLEPIESKEPTMTRQFFVNVRMPLLPPPKAPAPGGERVRIKSAEAASYTWDEKLTLEFSEPTVSRLTIESAPEDLTTVFLIGDSTVTDTGSEDYASWGQMLPRFLPKIAVANHAHPGETIKSSLTALRIAKVLAQIKAGDHPVWAQRPKSAMAADLPRRRLHVSGLLACARGRGTIARSDARPHHLCPAAELRRRGTHH